MAFAWDLSRVHMSASLARAVSEGVSAGAAAACARFVDGAWHVVQAQVGATEPGGPAVQRDTPYDLASVTKPFVAMATLSLAARGVLDLTCPVGRYLPELSDTPGGAQSLEALLSHRAGLSPWGDLFRTIPGGSGSPETRAYMLREAASRVGPTPRSPGSVYSDLGYLLAAEVASRAAGKPLDRVVADEVTTPLALSSRVCYPAALDAHGLAELTRRVAPTEYCAWRGRVVRGEVHDENCAAFGGISGHAGLFGDAGGVLGFGMALLDVLGGRSTWLDRDRLQWALAPRATGGHVVGWDTKSETGSSAGTRFSPRSFGHLGFTGTSLWCDPERALCAVLLTNRVHPTRDNILIRAFRPRFHDDLLDALEGADG